VAEKNHHVEIIEGITAQMKDILEGSEQAMYIYLDNVHKVCNRNFAAMLGFESPREWARLEDPVGACVAENSQRALIDAYEHAVTSKVAVTLPITLKHQMGASIETEFMLAPIAFQRHTLVVHYIQR
jgi:hypothetical protein